MTGPEHYHEAERLLLRGTAENITEAQVHATLALAAATAEAGGLANWGDLSGLPATPWASVLSAGQQQDDGEASDR